MQSRPDGFDSILSYNRPTLFELNQKTILLLPVRGFAATTHNYLISMALCSRRATFSLTSQDSKC